MATIICKLPCLYCNTQNIPLWHPRWHLINHFRGKDIVTRMACGMTDSFFSSNKISCQNIEGGGVRQVGSKKGLMANYGGG